MTTPGNVTGRDAPAISEDQADAIMECLEWLEPVCVYRSELPTALLPDGAGIYVFLRNYWGPLRIYVGMSERIAERVREQLHIRRWANCVLIFGMEGSLRRETLAILERRLLRQAQAVMPPAIWDNVQHVLPSVSPTPSDWGHHPVLEKLAIRILDDIRERMLDGRVAPAAMTATHALGHVSGKAYGLGCRTGRWLRLLPGSRLTRDCATHRAIWQRPRGCELVAHHLRSGRIHWMKGTLTRPAGFVVGEPIQFGSAAAATEFLFVGDAAADEWKAWSKG